MVYGWLWLLEKYFNGVTSYFTHALIQALSPATAAESSSMTTGRCRRPRSSSPSTTRGGPPCWGQFTASWRRHRTSCSTRWCWWMTTVTEVCVCVCVCVWVCLCVLAVGTRRNMFAFRISNSAAIEDKMGSQLSNPCLSAWRCGTGLWVCNYTSKCYLDALRSPACPAFISQ